MSQTISNRLRQTFATMAGTVGMVVFLAWYFESIESFPCEFSMLGVRGPSRFAFAIGLVLTAIQLMRLHTDLDSDNKYLFASLGINLRFDIKVQHLAFVGATCMALLGIFNSTTGWILAIHGASALTCFLCYSVYIFVSPLPFFTRLLPLIVGVARRLIGIPFKMYYAFAVFDRSSYININQLIRDIQLDKGFTNVVKWTSPLQWIHIILLMVCVYRHLVSRLYKIETHRFL